MTQGRDKEWPGKRGFNIVQRFYDDTKTLIDICIAREI